MSSQGTGSAQDTGGWQGPGGWQAAGGWQGPGGSGSAGPPRRLERSKSHKMVAGVAGGLGEYFGLDPVIFRIGFAVLALAGGGGLLAYAVAWAVLPMQDRPLSAVQAGLANPAISESRTKKIVAGLLILLGLVTMLGDVEFLFFDGKLAKSLVLAGVIAAVVWLVSQDRDAPQTSNPPPPSPYGGPTPPGSPYSPHPQASPPWSASQPQWPTSPPPPPTSPGPAAGAGSWPGPEVSETVTGAPSGVEPVVAGGPDWLAGSTESEGTESLEAIKPIAVGDQPDDPGPGDTSQMSFAASGPPTGPPTTAAPFFGAGSSSSAPSTRDRSLTAVVISVLLVGAGLAALVGVSAVVFLSSALLVVGLALLSGGRWGRSRGLIPVGIILVAALGVASAVRLVRVPLRDGAGERTSRPISVSGLQDEYRLGVGELRLDLSQVSFSTREPDGDLDVDDVEVDASVGAGELTVAVGDNVNVEVKAQAGLGRLDLFGKRTDGPGIQDTVFSPAVNPGIGEVPTVELNLEVGMGEVRVRRGGL